MTLKDVYSLEEAMTNLDSTLKSRDITLPTNVRLVKAMVFLVVMYGCESWSIKRAECQRIDVFELWCWRRLLRVPWTAGDPSSPFQRKSVLNIHWKDWHWSWNPKTLATWCEELTPWKRPWCWEKLKVGGKGNDRGWDGWMSSSTQWAWVWVNSGSWWWTRRPGMLQSMGLQRVGHDSATELNWTESVLFFAIYIYSFLFYILILLFVSSCFLFISLYLALRYIPTVVFTVQFS